MVQDPFICVAFMSLSSLYFSGFGFTLSDDGIELSICLIVAVDFRKGIGIQLTCTNTHSCNFGWICVYIHFGFYRIQGFFDAIGAIALLHLI